MREREVEKLVSAGYFVSVLRRVADAVEQDQSVRIQVKGRRFTVPKDAELIVEHEVEGDHQELSLELIWKHQAEPGTPTVQQVQQMLHTAQTAAQRGQPPEPAMAEWGEPEEWDEEMEEEDEDEYTCAGSHVARRYSGR